MLIEAAKNVLFGVCIFLKVFEKLLSAYEAKKVLGVDHHFAIRVSNTWILNSSRSNL